MITETVLQDTDKSLSELATSGERRVTHLNTDFETPDDVVPMPLRTAAQVYCLLNLCHKAQRPRHEQPGFRLLGSFPSHGHAAAFAAEAYPNPTETCVLIPMHQLVPICTSADSQLDFEYTKRVLDEIIREQERMVREQKQEFERTVDEQRLGTAGNSIHVLRERARRKREDSSNVQVRQEEFRKQAAELPSSFPVMTASKSVAGQRFAVIVILADIRGASLSGAQELEPLVAVLHCSETEEEAELYAKHTAKKVYKDCVVDVVSMYQWGFPETVKDDEILSEAFGNSELDSIMKTRRKTNKTVKEYDEWYQKSLTSREDSLVELDPAPEQLEAKSEVVVP